MTRPVEAASTWSEQPPTDDTDLGPGCDAPDVVDPSEGRRDAYAAIESLDRSKTSAIWVSDPSTDWDGPFVLTVVVPSGSATATESQVREHYPGALCIVERDQPTLDELEELQDDVIAPAMGDDGSLRSDTPLGPILGLGTDELEGVIELEVLVADERARAFARERWGDLVELDGVLQPVD
ncbi:hypothetical protein BH23ACT10_BH23ACT10_14590 [soil metagenome]